MVGRQARGKATFERIVAAVLDEFEEFGYAGASFSSVAARAGLTKSLVSYHFKTKADMAAMVFERAFPGGVFMGTVECPDPLERLVRATEAVARAIVDSQVARVALRLQDERALIGLDEPPSPYVGWVEQTRAALDQAVTRGLLPGPLDAEEEALLLVGMFAGLREILPLLPERESVVRLATLNTVRRLRTLGAANVSVPADTEQAGA